MVVGVIRLRFRWLRWFWWLRVVEVIRLVEVVVVVRSHAGHQV